jgi:hypothetical protein
LHQVPSAEIQVGVLVSIDITSDIPGEYTLKLFGFNCSGSRFGLLSSLLSVKVIVLLHSTVQRSRDEVFLEQAKTVLGMT